MPTLLPCSIVILLTRILLCFYGFEFFFPFVKPQSFMFGKDFLRARITLRTKGGIRQVWCQRARTEYPNFGEEARKFAEGCRQALRHHYLTFLPSAIPLHRKKSRTWCSGTQPKEDNGFLIHCTLTATSEACSCKGATWFSWRHQCKSCWSAAKQALTALSLVEAIFQRLNINKNFNWFVWCLWHGTNQLIDIQ